MNPGQYDITLVQGSTFSQVFTWRDSSGDLVNLTGYTARMQAREAVEAADTFISLTTENGGISLGGAAGTITLSITAVATAAITKNGVYDIELVSGGGIVTRLLQGNIILSKEVTR